MSKTSEDRLQKECIKWIKSQYPKALVHHSPNGGNRSEREGAKFKDMGTSPGFPDVAIYNRSGDQTGLAIELKVKYESGKKNYATPAQKAWLASLRAEGWETSIAYSIDEFMHTVNTYFNQN